MKRIRYRKEVDKAFRQGEPVKELTVGLVKKGGRNHHGRITVRHQGGGHKQSYRQLGASVGKWQVKSIEYDPNRTGWISLVENEQNEQRYVVTTNNTQVNDQFRFVAKEEMQSELGSLESSAYNNGDRVAVKMLAVGSQIHSVQPTNSTKSKIACAAGTAAEIVRKEEKRVLIKCPSGQQIWLHHESYATVGQVSNSEHNNRIYGKAGVSRWRGIRPTVRGIAMNPVDHPHGGGGGKSKGGRPSATPWGRLTKGKPTAKKRRTKHTH